MRGLMMEQPLLISSLIRHADRHHGTTEIVSRRVEGDVHRYNYHEAHRRSRQMANALSRLGVRFGDRVATLCWNGYRHLELYYAISGMGAVCHTVNPRLFPEQIGYIVNHAEDGVLFFDSTFLPLVAQLRPHLNSVRHYVLLADRGAMPADSGIPDLLCYEDLIDNSSDDFEWPEFDENTASSLCYTSGTTGNPKGALYSHRSNVLHAFGVSLPDSLNLSGRDTVLPVVPMFHANSWGLVYAAPLNGSKLVFPGRHLDGKSVYELFESEQVTLTGGVPTVWLAVLDYMKANGLKFSTLKRTAIGGTACPRAMMESLQDEFGVEVLHAWGMTELSPLGTVSIPKAQHRSLDREGRYQLQVKQGRAVFGVDMKIVDAENRELPWDGKAFGDLYVRGPWIIRDYFKAEKPTLVDGWFPTGDVSTIDPDGFMQIVDRSKDVVKSGGEWISSIDVENVAMSHPAIYEAGVIGVKHPKWEERPLLVVVRKSGHQDLTKGDLLKFFDGKIAKWWIPDDVIFVDEMPHTATGKLNKLRLREAFGTHYQG